MLSKNGLKCEAICVTVGFLGCVVLGVIGAFIFGGVLLALCIVAPIVLLFYLPSFIANRIPWQS